MESIMHRLEQVEERIPGTENKVEELSYSDSNKEEREKSNCDYNIEDFCDMTNRPNLQICGVEEGTEIQTKSKENLFNKIVTEIPPNLEEMDIQTHKAFRTLNKHDQKTTSSHHIVVEMLSMQKKKEH
jgi:hypothetical protein